MENQKSIFRNWSWKRFILDFLFFFSIQLIVGYLLSFIDFFKSENGFYKEIKSILFQAILMSSLFTFWDDYKGDAVIIKLYKNYFINEFKYTTRFICSF
jgi:hypothetical protein